MWTVMLICVNRVLAWSVYFVRLGPWNRVTTVCRPNYNHFLSCSVVVCFYIHVQLFHPSTPHKTHPNLLLPTIHHHLCINIAEGSIIHYPILKLLFSFRFIWCAVTVTIPFTHSMSLFSIHICSKIVPMVV